MTATNCTSCHASPPNGFSSPNSKGSHPVHYALQGVTAGCDWCHAGAGSTSSLHYNGAIDVLLVSTYHTKSGPALHNADGTCSSVSCHGGVATPPWYTGTIDVNTQCTACHVSGTAQYNGYSSGEHEKHISLKIQCITCHDTEKLAVNHFTHLETNVMEGPASATLVSHMNYRDDSCAPFYHAHRNW